MEILRIVIRGREFYVEKEVWDLYLKKSGNTRDEMERLLIEAEAIASEDPKQVRIITKYVN